MSRTEVVTITNMCMVYKDNTVLIQDKFDGQLKSSDEGEVYWIEFDKLLTMNLAEDMEETLQIFLDDNLSELYYYKEYGEWVDELK